MVTVEIVINSTRIMGVRVAISCRYCIAFEVMLLFLVNTEVSLLVIEGQTWVNLIYGRRNGCVWVFAEV